MIFKEHQNFTSLLAPTENGTVEIGQKTVDGLVSLFNGISTLFRLFNAKAILVEEQ